MALPKLDHPTFDIIVPSTKKKIKIRPMLVKEEKILLMAKESRTPADIFQAIIQILNNCILESKFDVNELTLFDVEYLFIRLRAISVSNMVEVTYKDNEDQKDYTFKVDLDKIEVKFPENISMQIQTGEAEGFTMRYPRATLYSSESFKNEDVSEVEIIEDLILNSIESYFTGEKVYKLAENTKEEIKEFVDNIDINTFNKIKEFVSNLPSMEYEIKYKNGKGTDRSIHLTTLSDFFTLL